MNELFNKAKYILMPSLSRKVIRDYVTPPRLSEISEKNWSHF